MDLHLESGMALLVRECWADILAEMPWLGCLELEPEPEDPDLLYLVAILSHSDWVLEDMIE